MQPVDVTHMRLHTAKPREIRYCVGDVITQNMQPVDVTHMRLHTAKPREIRYYVGDVMTQRLQTVTGAGHGMLKVSGNQNTLLSDANLQRFDRKCLNLYRNTRNLIKIR